MEKKMATYVYLGQSGDQQKKYIKKYMESLVPPEPRGQESKYTINKDDSEQVRDAKKKARADWLKKMEIECTKGLQEINSKMVFGNPDNPEDKIVFPLDKPVDVPDSNPLCKKLDTLCGVGEKRKSLYYNFKKVETKSEKPKEK
jgi:hypothetical protein